MPQRSSDAPTAFHVKIRQSDACCSVRVRGEVDLASCPVLTVALNAAEAVSPAPIVLDLSAVRSIDSTGIAALIHAARRSHDQGKRLHIVASPDIERLADICGLTRNPHLGIQAA